MSSPLTEKGRWAVDRSFYPLPLIKKSALRRGKTGTPFLAGIAVLPALIFLLLTVPLKKNDSFSAYHESPRTLARYVNQTPSHPKFKIADFASLTQAFVNLFIEEILTPDTGVGAWITRSPDGSLILRKARNADGEEDHSLLRRLQRGDSLAEEILLKKIQQKAEREGPRSAYLCLAHILWYGEYRDPFIWKDFEQLYSRLVMDGEIHFRSGFGDADPRIFGPVLVHANGAGASPAGHRDDLTRFVIAGSPKTGELHLFCREHGKNYHVGKIGQFPAIERIYEKDVGLPPEFSVHSYFMGGKIHLRGDGVRYWFFDGISWVRRALSGPEATLEEFSLSNPRHKVVALDRRGNYTVLEMADHKNFFIQGSP